MPRAVWKGPFFSLPLLRAIRNDTKKAGVKTFDRSSTVIPQFVGAKLLIHTGNAFKSVVITQEMVGMKVGRLAPTIQYTPFKVPEMVKKNAKKAAGKK